MNGDSLPPIDLISFKQTRIERSEDEDARDFCMNATNRINWTKKKKYSRKLIHFIDYYYYPKICDHVVLIFEIATKNWSWKLCDTMLSRGFFIFPTFNPRLTSSYIGYSGSLFILFGYFAKINGGDWRPISLHTYFCSPEKNKPLRILYRKQELNIGWRRKEENSIHYSFGTSFCRLKWNTVFVYFNFID